MSCHCPDLRSNDVSPWTCPNCGRVWTLKDGWRTGEADAAESPDG